MKKIHLFTAAFLCFTSLESGYFLSVASAAANQTAEVSVTVASSLSLTVAVKELDASGLPVGPDLGSSMNFGELVKDGNNAQWGTRAFSIFLSALTSGRPYAISGTMPPPSNGTNVLPNATVLKIIDATRGGNDIPGDVFDTAAQAAVMNNNIVYASSPAGDPALINLTYGISGAGSDGSAPFSGWEGIPSDFTGGEYSSTVSYSLVLL